MASGCPCIVSRNCGCYYDLIKDSNTGWGFDSLDAKELANLMQNIEVLNHSELIKLKKNIKTKIKNYSLENYYQGIKNAIYEGLNKNKFSILSSFTCYLLFKFKLNRE